MVSQKEIADATGVSIMTVSRALRNHPDLAPATREIILRKAAELGYVSPTANDPRRNQPQRIGVLVYELGSDGTNRLNEGVPRRIFSAIQKECKQRGVEVLIEALQPSEVPLLLRNKTIDRAFLFGRYTPETLQRLNGLPVMAVSSYIECKGLPRIIADNEGGIREATEHLIRLGHRRIAFLGIDENEFTEIFHSRETGYLATMCRHGLTPLSRITRHADGPLDLAPFIKTLSKATAVVCATDFLAFMLDFELRRLGWDLPRRCSITGFDNVERETGNHLTSYSPDWSLMGTLAAKFLLDHLEDIRGENIRLVVPGELVVRQSTAAVNPS